jgi:hypothetical protein
MSNGIKPATLGNVQTTDNVLTDPGASSLNIPKNENNGAIYGTLYSAPKILTLLLRKVKPEPVSPQRRIVLWINKCNFNATVIP